MLILASLLTSASAAIDTPRQEALMDSIEHVVKLPAGARGLHEYSRSYAYLAAGKVVAIYFIPSPPIRSCVDHGRVCTRAEVQELERRRLLAEPIPPHGRRWFTHEDELPHIFDGGCDVIHFRFDIETETVAELACNGIA